MNGCRPSSVGTKTNNFVSLARWTLSVIVLITMAGSLLGTDSARAQQLSPRGQYIADQFEDGSHFNGQIWEENGILKIAGRIRIKINNTEVEREVSLRYDLRTRAFSTESLAPPGNPNTSGRGTNISDDGSCGVGYQDNGFNTPFHAFRWTAATGLVDLGTLDTANNTSRSSVGTDTNQDCSVVVGFSDLTANGAIQHAFRWSSAGGPTGTIVDLLTPTNGGPISRAFGVSSNGTVVVGDADFVDPNNHISGKSRKAFRWTQAGGFQNLGDLQPTGLAIATAVTGDGPAVVGQATVSNGSRAFLWTTQTQTMNPIGPLPGHTQAAATAVSDNGKIIAGISHPTFLQYQGPVLGWNPGTAFRWTQAKGIQDLR